jgi:hypothetical protein
MNSSLERPWSRSLDLKGTKKWILNMLQQLFRCCASAPPPFAGYPLFFFFFFSFMLLWMSPSSRPLEQSWVRFVGYYTSHFSVWTNGKKRNISYCFAIGWNRRALYPWVCNLRLWDSGQYPVNVELWNSKLLNDWIYKEFKISWISGRKILVVFLWTRLLKGQCHENFDPRFFSSNNPT